MGRAKDLADILRLTPKELTRLIVQRSVLYAFKDEVIGGKARSLAVPINEMRRVHDRIKDLLGRIILPDYLFSPRRGRAAVDNALVHLGRAEVVKLDVKQFYPSTTSEHVFQFLKHRLGMADDVAGRLTKICTINGRVPFGSPLSPVLCALVHDDLFSKVAERCELHGDELSLWVDDVTVSGDRVAKGLVRDIIRLIERKGLKAHKAQRSTARKGIVITGTFIGPKGPAPANKSHLKMHAKLMQIEAESDPAVRVKLVQSAIGMVNHQLTIYPDGGEDHSRLKARRQWLWNEFRSLSSLNELAASAAAATMVATIPPDASVPWN